MQFKFNQTILNSLSERMKLEEIPLTEDLKKKDSLSKEKKIKNKLYKSEKIERVVLTEILTSDSIENHNGLIYPGECYDFPIFDFMFHLFEEGMLAVTEFYLLRKDKSYLEKYIFPMKELYQEAQKIPEPMPNTFEWIKEFSSGHGFFLGSTKEHLPEIEKIFKSYLELWIGYVEKAEPIADPTLKDSASNFKKKFCTVFHENVSDFDNLYGNFGEEWTERYYREVIY